MAYSYTLFTGNGSTTQYAVAFGYIRREHVLATVAGSPATFTWVNSSLIQMDTAPANGAEVRVYRVTPLSAPLVDFTDGATLVAADLDTNAKQSIYTQQELDDELVDGLAGVIPNGDKGDITTSVGGAVWTIDTGAVTSAKIADGTIVNGDINASAAIAGTKLAFTPAGGVAAITVQAAIEELDTEKAPIASPTFTGTPVAPTAAAGTNTTQLATTAFVIANAVPTGSVFYFAASSAPVGFLTCNGDTVTNGSGTVQGITANFAALYAILGSTYGSAGKLPDLRGEFIRGLDGGRGVDSGRTLGSAQAQSYQSHNHTITDPGHFHTSISSDGQSSPADTDYTPGEFGAKNIYENTTSKVTGITIDNSGSTETRPRNIALLACIKY
jgi:microcystin-dependent protein